MTTSTDTDRTKNGRFVRNLALSLSGGAVLTLLGASAAHADDLSDAGTVSDGTGKAHSGDATAVGNQSSTNNTQTVTVSGNLGTIQIINQQANVSNTGVGVANTGGNIAIGNSSNNTARGDQDGVSGLGPASNTGTAGNSSNGSASISTGNASSIGNQSNTTLNQTAHGSAHGVLGGILIINQDATVTNSGVALANTGGNNATGNESDNRAGLVQDANNAAGIAANSGKATNASDGKGYINTGNASATGNKSDTSITQSATGSAGGALGGLVIIDQNAFVVNSGMAVANSGGNTASGNSSTNRARAVQDIDTNGLPDAIGVASNNGEASNWSDGTAGITTGDASALGNDSKTTINQNADVEIEGFGGGALVTQGTNVINAGIGIANSGDNTASGNESNNRARVRQDVPSTGADFIGVAGNFGLAQNTSDGTGTIHSGKASAGGNKSETTVNQASDAKGGAFNLHTQANGVQNIGGGFANSGDNDVTGNDSRSRARVTQDNLLPEAGIATDVGANFGMADNTSDGTASITTGDASAKGNVSSTHLSQTIDPTGLVIPVQVADVVNAGVGVANTGGNTATGNDSNNRARVNQDVEVGNDNAVDPTIIAGTLIANNDGQASNASDGSASIHTGNASATGNESATDLSQNSNGTIDGMGLILNTQVAGVANVGLGVANSGDNTATGNVSRNRARLDQDNEVASDNGADTTILAGVLAASNNGIASNASDGSASIHTGHANATGNRSATQLSQDADGDISGLGGVINTQAAGVLNGGVGIANSGGNTATGNASNNEVDADQDVEVGTNNDDDVTIIAGVLTATNDGEASNASDGSADIHTGAADATGNASSTKVDQVNDGDVSGLGMVLNTQVAGVANVGLGVANSGGNTAVGNISGSDAELDQRAEIGSDNDGTVDILAGSVSAANAGRATNTSDGDAKVHTGGAQAQGNVSTTNVTQDPHSSVEGMGMVIGTQIAGVANVGVGVANSGLNEATGNESGSGRLVNDADLDQNADIGADNGDVDLTALSVTALNAGEASNTSDGSAKVKTGGALATGNASATNVTQNQSGNVSEMGLVIGTQVAGVANVGVGVANSGLNEATGNASTNVASNTQNADIVPDPGTPVIVFGPAVASNFGSATNDSDGEACVCTGNAVASGNVSSTTVLQDLDLSTGSGLVILTETGGVLNAGLGVANSGLNEATGNASQNTATTTQDAVIEDAIVGLPFLPPQVANNGGGAGNSSNGKALVASGNASGTGNQSTTNFAQVAAVDSDLAISSLNGGTSNTGLGLANSGLNVGIGNRSINEAVLDQDADGAGIVSNQGEATNDSDGDATIGDPSKCDDEVPGTPTPTPPTTTTPGKSGLPVTGGPLEVEAALALMLLLAGFGLRRKGQSLA